VNPTRVFIVGHRWKGRDAIGGASLLLLV